MSVVGAVFARGGSKGIAGKNLAVINGRSLVARAVDCARSVPGIDRVIVSTDDPAIAREGRAAGADTPFLRPAELAADDSAEWLAWRHAVAALRAEGSAVDTLVSIPPTSPLRDPSDVQRVLDELASPREWDAVITVAPARRHPAFNMVRVEEGRAVLAEEAGAFHRRQDTPALFDICTVAYAARAEYVLSATGLLAGRVGVVVIPEDRSWDIDTPFDLEVARLLLTARNQ